MSISTSAEDESVEFSHRLSESEQLELLTGSVPNVSGESLESLSTQLMGLKENSEKKTAWVIGIRWCPDDNTVELEFLLPSTETFTDTLYVPERDGAWNLKYNVVRLFDGSNISPGSPEQLVGEEVPVAFTSGQATVNYQRLKRQAMPDSTQSVNRELQFFEQLGELRSKIGLALFAQLFGFIFAGLILVSGRAVLSYMALVVTFIVVLIIVLPAVSESDEYLEKFNVNQIREVHQR